MKFQLGSMIRKFWGNAFDHIESMEMIEMLRLDFEKGIKVVLTEIILKDGSEMSDLNWPVKVKMNVLHQNGSKYVVIVTAKAPSGVFSRMFKNFQADVIWTTPSFFKSAADSFEATLSCIGEEDELKKVLRTIKLFGIVADVSFRKAVYQEHNLLTVLTPKQKDVILTAKRLGYYDYPRKIDASGLAVEVGISKATAVEHLRKAENRLISNILAGY